MYIAYAIAYMCTLYQNHGLNASVHDACPWFYWKSL